MDIRYELIVYWSDQDNAFVVDVPELPGCMADGQTYEEAVKNAQVVIQEWIETARDLDRVVEPDRLNQQGCSRARFSGILTHRGRAMTNDMTVTKILSKIEQLSYSDQMKLVESIVRSVRLSAGRGSESETEEDAEALFGMWRDRDVTVAGIREKAWRQR
jgi:predicted RNase H-like HicB family nuclease